MTTAVRTPRRLYPSGDLNAYQRWVRRQRGYGLWEPFVDAQPIREHVQKVMAAAGIGSRQYADLTGVPRNTLSYLLYGSGDRTAKRIAPANARKLLSLQADTTQGLITSAIGAQRRIQALAVEGWPQVHLGPIVGTHTHYIWHILQAERITVATAEAVAAAYERLRNADPISEGVSAHGVRLVKGMARRNGWRDRTYWEDVERIDDPDFDPTAADLPLKRNELAELRKEEIEHLAWCGNSPDAIFERLNGELSQKHIREVVLAWQKGAKRDRSKREVTA